MNPGHGRGLMAACVVAALVAVAVPAASAGASARAPAAAKTRSAVPRTPAEVAASWVKTPWTVVAKNGSGGDYYFSGFKSEAEYGKLSVRPPSPPPLTQKAQSRYDDIRRQASEGHNTLDVAADCSKLAFPFLIGFNTFEMLFSPNRVTIIQFDGEIRRIWTDGRSHPKEILLPQDAGHSIGHWEGATLVIDTVGMRPDRYIEPGLPHSDQFRMVERWSPIEGDRIRNDITFIDPVDFTKPWHVTRFYARDIPASTEDSALQFLDWTCENNKEVRTPEGVVLLGPDGKPLIQ